MDQTPGEPPWWILSVAGVLVVLFESLCVWLVISFFLKLPRLFHFICNFDSNTQDSTELPSDSGSCEVCETYGKCSKHGKRTRKL